MHILALTSALPVPYRGGELRSFHFLKHLHRQYGHQITLISLHEPSPSADALSLAREFCADLQTVAIPRGGTLAKKAYSLGAVLSPRHLFSKSHTFLNPGYSPAMDRKVHKALSSDQFDVVLACSLYSAYYLWDVPAPKVVDSIDALPQGCLVEMRRARNPIRKLWLLLFYHANVRETRRVQEKGFYALTVTSPYDADILRRYLLHMKIVPIPNGVDTEYFAPRAEAAEEPSLVFTGSIGPHAESILYFCRSILPHIKERVPNVRFYLVGQGPSPRVLELGHDPAITVTGFVPDVRPYLARAWVAVVPVFDGLGISNKMLEAMAMGKSVVATPAQARGIDLISGTHAAIAATPQEFADRVVELLEDETKRRAMGYAARALVENRYTWRSAAHQLHTLLEEAVRAG